jgi:hypothetical protein
MLGTSQNHLNSMQQPRHQACPAHLDHKMILDIFRINAITNQSLQTFFGYILVMLHLAYNSYLTDFAKCSDTAKVDKPTAARILGAIAESSAATRAQTWTEPNATGPIMGNW